MRSRARPTFPHDTCCVVSGGTGWVGRHVVRFLIEQGVERVCVVTRRGTTSECSCDKLNRLREFCDTSNRIELLEVDPSRLLVLPSDTEYVVHCAGAVQSLLESAIMEANLLFAWRMLAAASRLDRLRRYVHLSTLLMRGDSETPFSESSLDIGQHCVSAYTLSKFLAEVMIQKFPHSLPVTIVRLGAVLAPLHISGAFNRDWLYWTLNLWQQGRLRAVPLTSEESFYPVPVDWASQVIGSLLTAEQPPAVVHIPAEPGPPVNHVFSAAAKVAGRDPPDFYAQHSTEWRCYHKSLPSEVRRIVSLCYPPPPAGSKLCAIDSSASRAWLARAGIVMPELSESYWRRLAEETREDTSDTQDLCTEENSGSYD